MRQKTQKSYDGYVNDCKILGKPYDTFTTWAARSAPAYTVASQKRDRADLDLKHSQAIKNGVLSNLFYRALTDITAAVQGINTPLPGLTMVINSGSYQNRRKKLKRRSLYSSRSFKSLDSKSISSSIQNDHSSNPFPVPYPLRHSILNHRGKHPVPAANLYRRDNIQQGPQNVRYGIAWSIPTIWDVLKQWQSRAPDAAPDFIWNTSTSKHTDAYSKETTKLGHDFDPLPSFLSDLGLGSLHANIDHTKIRNQTHDMYMNVGITFQGVALFPVEAGFWWQLNWGYVSMLDPDQNEDMANVTGYRQLFDSNFAPEGSLHRLHNYVLLAYKPKIEIEFTKSDFNYMYDLFDGGVKICILFFCNGYHIHNEKSDTKTSFVGNTMVIETTSESPVIIAKGFSAYP